MKKPNFTIGVEAEKIAKKVLLTPDIESCVHVAETYMQNYVKFNGNKNFTGYTGTYKGKPVTVISAGLGSAMMGFLADDLFDNYDVESVIYAGLCDSLKEEIGPRQYVLAADAESDTTMDVAVPDGELAEAIKADFENRLELVNFAYESPILNIGSIVSADYRFLDAKDAAEYIGEDLIAADTASYTLLAKAEAAGKKAAALLLVDRNLITGEAMEDKEYQRTCMRQIVTALINL
ncbi:MAG: hypothetical protein IJC19_05625 [Clostridia bacterium]|nr:hypothetical protein [Clostridia bacterium]